MDALRKGQLKPAFEQFKYAEAVLMANQAEGDVTQLSAVTCNNLGCYYKKVGKYHGALSYLRRALKMEVELKTDAVTVAGTHLNVCAILSKLEKHDKAVQHALQALELIDDRVNGFEAEKASQDDYSVLAIAYHNVAVERDLLHQYDKAAAAFQQGYEVAQKFLGEDHPLSITLGKNCDAVLMKSRKLSKAPAGLHPHRAMRPKQALDDDMILDLTDDGGASRRPPALPSISSARGGPSELEATLPIAPARTFRQEAADWVSKEESAWNTFAQSTLGTEPAPPAAALSPKQVATPRDAKTMSIPRYHDTQGVAPSPRKTALARVVDDHPEALMDLIDGEHQHQVGCTRTVPNDYRPNRTIKGTTRTSRVVRRTGMYNSTKHRDLVMSGRDKGPATAVKEAYRQRCAAEKIQRTWRAWHKYCHENADWMTTTWIAATIIQSRWRSYHVRRLKMDAAATCIQRHFRGFIVRLTLKRHRAAVTIQRHMIGVLTRMQLLRMQQSAIKMQKLTRGGLGRKYAREKRRFLSETAITLQCATRVWIANRVVGERRAARNLEQARQKGATDMQRLWRGHKGRQRFAAAKLQYQQDLAEYHAARRLQAMIRRGQAIKRVDMVRTEKLAAMHKAATVVQRMWLGANTKKKYLELLGAFRRHEAKIVTIQRFARGFLVRLRMWREAIRAEEELWAAVEMQRIWRGYLGRVRYENKLEEVWRRELAAAALQRNLRGFVARAKVGRMRRRIARAEFERARARFRAAQRIQALARGMLVRKVTRVRHARATRAAVAIQRIWRGHQLRQRLWTQIVELRATTIQKIARGFLVRQRHFRLVAKVIHIQRAYRRARCRPQHLRNEAIRLMRQRDEQAAFIQARFRKHREKKAIGLIHATDGSERAAASALLSR